MTAGPPLAFAAASCGALAARSLVMTVRAPRRRRGGDVPHAALALRLLARAGARLGARSRALRLAGRLEQAGSPLALTARDLAAAKAAGGVLGLAGAATLLGALPPRLWPAVLAAGAAGGHRVPDVWLSRLVRMRAARLARDLPDVLELLRVAAQAGLSPARALEEVGRRHGGLLASELARVGEAISLGVRRDDALAALVRRCPGPGVAALAAAIARAERYGAPLADTLAAQALDARGERARRVVEAAARAAPQIQLAVALLLVPSALLLVGAAMVAALVR